MKKTEVSIKQKTFYKIVEKIGKFAVVEENGRLGLIILHSGQFMVSFGDYELDKEGDFLIFTKKKAGEEDTVTIFNVKNRYLYSESKVVTKFETGTMILRNRFDEKMNLFCSKYSCDVHNREFDSYTTGEMDNKYWIVLENDGKKSLFIKGKGLVLVDADDISIMGNKIIFSKDGYTQIKTAQITSSEYDSITIEPDLEDIIYCKKGNELYVYYIWHSSEDTIMVPILKTSGDTIKLGYHNRYSNLYHGTYQFIIGESGRYTIREITINSIDSFREGSPVTPVGLSYDAISYNSGVYILYSNSCERNDYPTEANEKNKKLEILYPLRRDTRKFYRTLSSENRDIACFSVNGEFYIEFFSENRERRIKKLSDSGMSQFEVKSITPVKNGFIFNDGTMDILFVKDKKGNAFSSLADEILWLGENYYLSTKNSVKTLHHYGKEISKRSILNATLHSDNTSDSFEHAKRIWIIMETDSIHNRFRLASVTHHEHKPATNLTLYNSYEWVAFYPDFILTLDEKITLYSYKGSVLAFLSPHTTIDVVGNCGGSKEGPTIYSIDGENYIIQDDEFIEIPVKERNLQMALYEGEYGYVAVNATSREEYDKKCAELENMSDGDFESTLKSAYNLSTEIQKKYPTLKLRQIQKK